MGWIVSSEARGVVAPADPSMAVEVKDRWKRKKVQKVVNDLWRYLDADPNGKIDDADKVFEEFKGLSKKDFFTIVDGLANRGSYSDFELAQDLRHALKRAKKLKVMHRRGMINGTTTIAGMVVAGADPKPALELFIYQSVFRAVVAQAAAKKLIKVVGCNKIRSRCGAIKEGRGLSATEMGLIGPATPAALMPGFLGIAGFKPWGVLPFGFAPE